MTIRQANTSGPILKFHFRELFNLRRYDNRRKALVQFGMYRKVDLQIVTNHKAHVVVVWTGNDSTKVPFKELRQTNITHATWLPRVKEYLKKVANIDAVLLKVPSREEPIEMPLGGEVYSYLQKSKPEYHGSKVVYSLNHSYPLLVGDHSILRTEWYAGKCDDFYRKAFIGLFLSEYTGGASGIIEMGLRGRRVVTNVLNLPNCVPWHSKEDVEAAIEQEAQLIGTTNLTLAEQVYACLASGEDLQGFNLDRLEITS